MMNFRNQEDDRMKKLPEGWKMVRLGEVAEVIMGQSPSSKTYNNQGVGLPFYQGKAEFGELYLTLVKWCSKPIRIAKKEDILLSIRAPMGPTNICLEESCIGRGLAAIRALEYVNTRFIFYHFRATEEQIAKIGQGSTFSAISKSQIQNLEIPLPSLREQEEIVWRIEELFSFADGVEKEIEAAKKKIAQLNQAILHQAFSGELTYDFRKAKCQDGVY
jgi:type I restriction enzyme S subunit